MATGAAERRALDHNSDISFADHRAWDIHAAMGHASGTIGHCAIGHCAIGHCAIGHCAIGHHTWQSRHAKQISASRRQL